MVSRLEYSQEQGRLHVMHVNNYPENTNSYRTIARNIEDDVCTNFLDMICDKYPALVPMGYDGNDKPPSFDTVQNEFDMFFLDK